MQVDRNGGSGSNEDRSGSGGRQGVWSPGRNAPPRPPVQIFAQQRRRTGPWLILGFAGILLSVVGVFWWTQPQDDSPQHLSSDHAASVAPPHEERTPSRATPGGAATSPTDPPVTLSRSSGAMPPDDSETARRDRSDDDDTTAIELLDDLPIKGRAPMSGYDRGLFGQAWADVDRNGCDTRNDILRRDLDGVTIKPGTHGCTVLTGALNDPYSGQRISFVRGGETSGLVQIDHVVALADAWQSGAQSWAPDRREEFANDPLNLLAVLGHLNQQKGASNAASWLPPARSSWCGYATQQVLVKQRYSLSITSSEHDALRRSLDTCDSRQTLAPPGEIPLATD